MFISSKILNGLAWYFRGLQVSSGCSFVTAGWCGGVPTRQEPFISITETYIMDSHYARLDATANILTALANLHEMGDSTEQEVCMVLNLLAYAIRHGKTAQMEAQYAVMADRWLAETEQALDMPEATL